MADSKITDLSDGGAIQYADEFVIARSGANNKIAGNRVTGADGWISDGNSPTYASATTFTVSTDLTTTYTPGARIKLTQTTAKYFVVASSSFGGGTTTVTIAAGSDYTLANAAITSPYYSYVVNPQGYPGWFTFAPATTGVTSAGGLARFACNGRVVSLALNLTGTSNSTAKAFTLPITPANPGSIQWIIAVTVKDNGSIQSTPGEVVINPATASADIYKTSAAGAWTNTGSWFAIGPGQYEI